MPEYDKPLIHAVDSGGNKVPVTVAMLSGGGGGGGGGGDASAANQLTEISRLVEIRNRLSGSDSDVIFTKLNELLIELQQKTEPANTQQISGTVTTIRSARTYLDFPTTTFSSSGDNTVISAPGVGQKLFISDYKIQNNTTTNAVAIVKKGATIIDRVKCASEGDGVVRDYDYDKELELPENTAFVVNLSAAIEFFISGRYRVASV